LNHYADEKTRIAFRDELRTQLKALEFYQRRGDHYLIREFHKYCVERGEKLRALWPEFTFEPRFFQVDEASLGRYLRDENPVLPTPDRVRALALILEILPTKLLTIAGYISAIDVLDPRPEVKAPKATKTAKPTKNRAAVTTVVATTALDTDVDTDADEMVEPEQLVNSAH